MLQYLKEMGTEEVHEFATSTDFERAFFSRLIHVSKPVSSHPYPVHELTPEIVTFLGATIGATTSPFNKEKTEVVVSIDKLQITHSDATELFSTPTSELITKSMTLDSLIPNEYQNVFKNLIENIKKALKVQKR